MMHHSLLESLVYVQIQVKVNAQHLVVMALDMRLDCTRTIAGM